VIQNVCDTSDEDKSMGKCRSPGKTAWRPERLYIPLPGVFRFRVYDVNIRSTSTVQLPSISAPSFTDHGS
jgi:hypothetical protein